MRVLRAINNNVVSCTDENGKELIVMGRGLGFQAKPGDILPSEAAEKVFRMTSDREISQMKDLFSQLPSELLELCSRIIDHANQVLDRRLSESIYLTLTDHVSFTIKQARSGAVSHNALMTEVRVFYPGEFAVGKYALELIADKQGIKLPEDEAASIAMHFVNAEYHSSMNATMHVAQALQPMMNIIATWPGLQVHEGHLFYDELVVHLKFLAMQAFSGQETTWSRSELAESVNRRFPLAYSCALAVTDYLRQQCGHAVSHEETGFLAICIQRACIS